MRFGTKRKICDVSFDERKFLVTYSVTKLKFGLTTWKRDHIGIYKKKKHIVHRAGQ